MRPPMNDCILYNGLPDAQNSPCTTSRQINKDLARCSYRKRYSAQNKKNKRYKMETELESTVSYPAQLALQVLN